jgi:catechol 2,3-dioxygenase-like lactoylglutathione lyase family enzyme
MGPPIPILRSFDETKAKEFYIQYLGFEVDWEHRFAPQMPLYMQISQGQCLLHLSEHHGDGTPGTRIRIEVPDLEAFLDRLRLSPYSQYYPGQPELQPWGLRECTILDPSGNGLILYAPA